MPTGAGKCLGRGTPVLLYDGRIKAAENIRVGDVLMGPDSLPRYVRSVTSGREMMYWVIPNKGERFRVNESHIHSLKMTNGYSNDPGRINEIFNISTLDILAATKTFRHCAKLWRPDGVIFPPQETLKLDPYFLGLWLGDGSSRLPIITTGDPEIKEFLFEYAKSLNKQCYV